LNVLFLTHRLPYAPNRGDRVRAYHLLRTLRARATVDVVSLVHDEEETLHSGEVADLVSSVRIVRVTRTRNLIRSAVRLPGGRPTTHTMLDAPDLEAVVSEVASLRRPDVVLAYCSGMARLAFGPSLRRLPFVLDMVDVDSAKWSALADVTRGPLRWVYRREARVLRAFEAYAAPRAVANMVVTDRERATLCSIAPAARVDVVPNGVDVDALQPRNPPADSQTVVFCGVMNYAPNEQAALLLAREVWPLVRQSTPAAQLKIVGAYPTRLVQSLADTRTGIEVTGSVPDVRPHLWSSAIAAAPIVTARGIQNKVLEAVAAGLPTVVTPNIFESLPDTVRPACVVGQAASDLAHAISRLLALSPTERRAMATRADVAALTWERQLEPAVRLLEDASAGRMTAPVQNH
jgi:sugar transferase (PEP-CTERM/EpsH1 system associated)